MANELAKGIQDTMAAADSDAPGPHLEIYTAVKHYSNKIPGLASSQEDLAFFCQRSYPRSAANPA